MKKNLVFLCVLIVFLFLVVHFYKVLNYTHITAEFNELHPHKGNLPIYYKGIVVGKAMERVHSEDFMHTLINLVLYPKNLLLPLNTEVYLKKINRDDKDYHYLELIYPKVPSLDNLKNGSVIKGVALVDFDDYMSNHHPDDLEIIKHNLTESSVNLNNAIAGLSDVFDSLSYILKENEKNIYTTTGNLVNTTSNLNSLSKKINNSLKQEIYGNQYLVHIKCIYPLRVKPCQHLVYNNQQI